MKHRKTEFRWQLDPCRSFTLVELLVAASITLLIVGVILGLITNSLGTMDQSRGRLAMADQARLALDCLERDLQGAMYRNDGNGWLAATIQPATSVSGVWVDGLKPGPASLNPAAASLSDARFGVAGVWLRFFAPASGSESASETPADPAAVSYQIIRRAPTPSASTPRYLFYRAEVTAAATVGAGYDLDAASYNTADDATGVPGSVMRPGIRQLLANDVIDFGVRFYSYVPGSDGDQPVLRVLFPDDSAILTYRAGPFQPGDTALHPFPAVADVFLRVLTEKGARQIAALESGKLTGDWWAIASANSRTFVRRILVRTERGGP